MDAGSGRAARAAAALPRAAAGAAAALPVDPYEARFAHLIANLPPDKVSADLRAMHTAFSLVREGAARLGGPAGGMPELAQGAVDLLRGEALEDAVLGARGITLSQPICDSLLAAIAARDAASAGALGGGASGAPELDLLASLVLVSELHCLADDVARLPPDLARAMEQKLLRAAEF
jgi:hypothetical protein